MSITDCARTSSPGITPSRDRFSARSFAITGFRSGLQCLAVVAAAGSLAACVQTAGTIDKTQLSAATPAPAPRHRDHRVASRARITVARKHDPFKHKEDVADAKGTSYGVASFYSEGTETASGEKFNAHDLTAAHPTLPFGTRLRVTNVSTGKSVTVRVNDRGPYVHGRLVDVSYSAAQQLGMIEGGVAKVKLEVE